MEQEIETVATSTEAKRLKIDDNATLLLIKGKLADILNHLLFIATHIYIRVVRTPFVYPISGSMGNCK